MKIKLNKFLIFGAILISVLFILFLNGFFQELLIDGPKSIFENNCNCFVLSEDINNDQSLQDLYGITLINSTSIKVSDSYCALIENLKSPRYSRIMKKRISIAKFKCDNGWVQKIYRDDELNYYHCSCVI